MSWACSALVHTKIAKAWLRDWSRVICGSRNTRMDDSSMSGKNDVFSMCLLLYVTYVSSTCPRPAFTDLFLLVLCESNALNQGQDDDALDLRALSLSSNHLVRPRPVRSGRRLFTDRLIGEWIETGLAWRRLALAWGSAVRHYADSIFGVCCMATDSMETETRPWRAFQRTSWLNWMASEQLSDGALNYTSRRKMRISKGAACF